MNTSPNRTRYNYDIFISHNRADKEWVRELTDELAGIEFKGRRLRPWLDEQFLDPGNLGSDDELTTAIDRSRFFGLVMSPEAFKSKWVEFEIRYFLECRNSDEIVPMLRRECTPSASLKDFPPLDFRGDKIGESALSGLIKKLCPEGGESTSDAENSIDEAFQRLEDSDPGGFDAEPTPERDALFAALSSYDIDDAVSEGLAVAAFRRAAERLLEMSKSASEALYNSKMLLGECLAGALIRSTGYRQVAQRFLDMAESESRGVVLLFAVARAYSKLAEIDPKFVDMSVILRACTVLDARPEITNDEKAIQALLARIIGKIRNSPAGELMIKTLCEKGKSSRIVAAGAISLSGERSGPVFYLSELEKYHETRSESDISLQEPPSRKLLGELFGLDLDQDTSVQRAVLLAKKDIEKDFPGTDFPYPLLWGIRKGIEVTHSNNAPFAGGVVKATLGNMVDLVTGLDVSNVACLTEPRIVDGLFDNCGALLILPQDAESPQCRRLRDRGVPFAMLSEDAMAELADGDQIVVDEESLSILKGTN